ncbi:hypothetical protein GCM10029964_063180 [Kibdelosporangium lantanae]
MLECLGERTVALAQQRRLADPSLGYERRLPARFSRLLPPALRNGVRIVTNMGAANPLAAGQVTRDLLDAHGLGGRVAVVTGDDVLADLDLDAPAWRPGSRCASTARSCRRTRTWVPTRCSPRCPPTW